MKKSESKGGCKRTQKDYSASFKLQIVKEMDQGQLTPTEATKNMVFNLEKQL